MIAQNENVRLENVGPIEEFEFGLPSGGGLVVLLGPQGCGKSQTLHAVDVLTSGRGTVPKRDGAAAGEVEGLGRTARVKKQTRITGELEVSGVGDLDIAELHTPRFKTAEARDRHRIKVLVRLSGTPADITLFLCLLSDNRELFDSIITEATRESEDLVEMAARVKRDIEQVCRSIEKRVETARANERAKRDLVGDVDLTAPSDRTKLDAALEAAIRHSSELEAKQQAAEESHKNAQQARDQLADLEASDSITTPETAAVVLSGRRKAFQAQQNVIDSVTDQIDAAEDELRKLRDQLEKEKNTAVGLEHRLEASQDALDSARNHATVIQSLREAIATSEAVESPKPDELNAAAHEVYNCREAVEQGVRVRDAQQAAAEADAYKAEAKKLNKQATQLRNAAQDTETVLSDAIATIPNCPLRVKSDTDGNARLVCDHPRRGPDSLFDEFSDGERWTVIVPLAAGENRVVALSQAAYGELQPKNQQKLDELAKGEQCWILTAKADDGPMRAETYAGEALSEVGEGVLA